MLNYVMTWSLLGYIGNLVSFAKFSHTPKKKKKKIHPKRNYQKNRSSKNNNKKKKICWTTWWLNPSPGYVGSLVLVTKFSHMKRRRNDSLAWRVFQRSSICFWDPFEWQALLKINQLLTTWCSKIIVVENDNCKELGMKSAWHCPSSVDILPHL